MNCWVLKTRENLEEPRRYIDHWDQFVAEGVVSIGWKIDVRPDTASLDELMAALGYPHECTYRQALPAAQTMKTFATIDQGDRILLCQGYAGIQAKPVRVYGTAQVTGPFFVDKDSDWWWYKRKAHIQPFGVGNLQVPKDTMVQIFGLGAMMRTLHDITCDSLGQFVNRFR